MEGFGGCDAISGGFGEVPGAVLVAEEVEAAALFPAPQSPSPPARPESWDNAVEAVS